MTNNKNISSKKLIFSEVWKSIAKCLKIIKKINQDISLEKFWKKTDLNWEKDIEFNGELSVDMYLKIEKNLEFQEKILKSLEVSFLQGWIKQKLEIHWNKFSDILLTIKKLNTPSLEKTFYKLTKLSFQKDLNPNFFLTEQKIKELFSDKKIDLIILLFQITEKILKNYLVNNFNNTYWNPNRVLINDIFRNGFDLQNFSLWKEAKLKDIYFENDKCTFKSDLLPVLLIKTINLSVIKKINSKSLKEFVEQEIFNHWNKLTPLLKRLEILNFSFAGNNVFFQTKLDWENDFEQGKLKKTASKKINWELSEQWTMKKKIDENFLLNFFQETVLNNWNKNKKQLEIMIAYQSVFFNTDIWKETQIDYKKDLLSNGSIKFPEKIINFSNEKIICFLNLKKNILDDYIRKEVISHWEEIYFILNKIFVFDKEQLFNQDFWKEMQFNYKKDLFENGNLSNSTKKNIPNWNIEKILAIKKVKKNFLKTFLIDLVVKHWDEIKSVVFDIKKAGYDCSDQRFWVFTNLNWHTDIKKDGSLNENVKKILPFKTINQIFAIKKLQKDFLESLLLTLQESSDKENTETSSRGRSFWDYFFFKRKKRTLNERLNNRIEISNSGLLKRVNNYKDYKNNNKIYNKLRKTYNSRITHNQDIVTINSEDISPVRYILEMYNVFKFHITEKRVEKTINNMSLKIERGDFLVILGPSGAGKSTMLNIMSGIDNVDSGDLLINGLNLSLLNEGGLTEFRREYVGFIFQQYNLLQNLTALENVEIGGALLPKFKQSMDMNEIYKFLQIDKLLDKYPFQLSGGQQQRFSIARALAKNPDLLFCDEPTGALDHKMSKIVMEMLFDINEKYGTSIVLVTHNPIFKQLAKTVLYIENGEIINIYKNTNPIHPKDIDFSFQKDNKK